jgi:hypothetical protein
MLMHAKRKQYSIEYTIREPQSKGSLASADESLDVLQNPKDKIHSTVLRAVPAITEEYTKRDGLSPAKGIIAGIGLSIMLWWLIILAINWIRY